MDWSASIEGAVPRPEIAARPRVAQAGAPECPCPVGAARLWSSRRRSPERRPLSTSRRGGRSPRATHLAEPGLRASDRRRQTPLCRGHPTGHPEAGPADRLVGSPPVLGLESLRVPTVRAISVKPACPRPGISPRVRLDRARHRASAVLTLPAETPLTGRALRRRPAACSRIRATALHDAGGADGALGGGRASLRGGLAGGTKAGALGCFEADALRSARAHKLI
jgi:hypothetical protein